VKKPSVATQEFFAAAQDFINDEVEDGALKAHYHMALLTELNNNTRQIDPRAFARSNLHAGHRQEFLAHLRERGVSQQAITKDCSLIEPMIKRTAIVFQNNVLVTAPAGAIGDSVKLEELKDGRTKVQVTDHVKAVKGRSR
jgi:hypothetical protein